MTKAKPSALTVRTAKWCLEPPFLERSMEEVHRCALKILETVSAPIDIADHQLVITASIGLCLYPDSLGVC